MLLFYLLSRAHSDPLTALYLVYRILLIIRSVIVSDFCGVVFGIRLDIELMKERFSKLLLGEDMSGCGKGVCTALAISNAITNLCGKRAVVSGLFASSW